MNWIRLNSPPIAAGQGLDRHRLGQAGDALDEEVAAREQGDDQPLEQVVLADDDLLDLVEHALHRDGPRRARRRHPLAVHLPVESVLGQAGRAAGDVDRHGQADADEDVLLGRVDERGDDPDDLAVAVEERTAGVARVDRGVDLDEPVEDLRWCRASRTTGRDPRRPRS